MSQFFFRCTSSSTLSVSASWYTWGSSCTATVSVTSRPFLSWVCSWTCLNFLCFNRSSCSIWRIEFFVKRIHTDLSRTGRVRSIFHVIRSPWSITDGIWSWLGCLEKLGLSNNFSFWLSNRFPFWSWITFGSINLNTTSWKYSLKDDCIRSSLIECQSFPNRKIDVDPIHYVLMPLPCIVHVLCMTRCIQVDHIRILVTLVHNFNWQRGHCLSLAQILTSKYESRVNDRMKIERKYNMVNMLEEVARNNNIVQMSFKSSEIDNYSWIISAVWNLLFVSPPAVKCAVHDRQSDE